MGNGCCCISVCHNTIAPAPWDAIKDQMITIRPGRRLHIHHINARQRDEQFAKEMQTFLLYKNQGVTSNGPMVVPRKPVVTLNQNVVAQSLISNSQPGVPLPNSQTSKFQSGEQTPDSTYSCNEDRKTLISASGIEVAVSPTPIETNSLAKNLDKVDKSVAVNNIPKDLNGLPSSVHNTNYTTRNSQDNKPSNSAIQPVKRDTNAVLFFIHGVGESADIWKTQLTYFASLGYEIVVPDLIGHGLSCAPRQLKHYHFDQIAADIEEIFDKYCKRSNVVIGHSYGCSFAAILARNRSRRVTKLIMISGGGPTPLAPQPSIFSLPVCMLTCLRPCVECKYKKSAFVNTKTISSASDSFSVPTYVLSHIMKGQIWADGDELYHNWIVCPTLLIYGRKDKLISLKDEQRMREAIYNSELEIISDASHMVMLEKPDHVNKLIHDFLLHNYRLEGNTHTMPHHQIFERSQSRASIRSLKSVKSIPDL